MSRWRRSAPTEAPTGEAPGEALTTHVVKEGEAAAGAGSRWARPSAAATPDAVVAEAPPRSLNFQSFVDLAGSRMPILGLGTRQLKGAECREAVKCALRCGYRLLDTCPGFGNEEEIAQGIRAAGLKREDVFLVSKLPPSEHGDDLDDVLNSSLERLGTSFIDLYLIQSPTGGSIIWTWDAMLRLRERGLAKAVGLCNFSVSQLEALQRTGRELPQVLQVELHLANQQKELCAFCQHHGIVLMSSSPLARGQLLRLPALQQLAQQRRRSAAELAIRWGLQRGFVMIPKSKTPAKVESNAAFGFVLSEEDMKFLSTLDTKLVVGQGHVMELPWEELLAEVSEVSDGDVGDDAPKRRRRRKKRKGKGKGQAGKGGKGGKDSKGQGAAGSAQRAQDVLFRLS